MKDAISYLSSRRVSTLNVCYYSTENASSHPYTITQFTHLNPHKKNVLSRDAVPFFSLRQTPEVGNFLCIECQDNWKVRHAILMLLAAKPSLSQGSRRSRCRMAWVSSRIFHQRIQLFHGEIRH